MQRLNWSSWPKWDQTDHKREADTEFRICKAWALNLFNFKLNSEKNHLNKEGMSIVKHVISHEFQLLKRPEERRVSDSYWMLFTRPSISDLLEREGVGGH